MDPPRTRRGRIETQVDTDISRNHGFHYLYNRAPNSVERLEMTYRSIGKQYDWELEKFRLGRKTVDKGNKRRLVRNLSRFVKHPVAYITYRLQRYLLACQPRALPVLIGLAFLGALYEWKQHTNEIKKYDSLLLAYGKNVEGMTGRFEGFHDTKPLRGPTAFDAFFRAPLTPDQIILNQTWKQNLRK